MRYPPKHKPAEGLRLCLRALRQGQVLLLRSAMQDKLHNLTLDLACQRMFLEQKALLILPEQQYVKLFKKYPLRCSKSTLSWYSLPRLTLLGSLAVQAKRVNLTGIRSVEYDWIRIRSSQSTAEVPWQKV